ncbi:MAG: DUF2061 domain-containing protein [Nitrospiraceae bacterium]|nr:DUF2061 domain-containing protein [Nitrospiraceae bacterium]
MARTVLWRRSVAKAVTYRVVIMCLDFVTIYLFTGMVRVAIGFMIASNLYTTVAYFLHERAWAQVPWGLDEGEAARG